MIRILIILSGLLALYLVPGIKTAYDSIFTNLFMTMTPTPSEFEQAVFKGLPLVLLVFVFVVVIYKAFKGSREGDGGE